MAMKCESNINTRPCPGVLSPKKQTDKANGPPGVPDVNREPAQGGT